MQLLLLPYCTALLSYLTEYKGVSVVSCSLASSKAEIDLNVRNGHVGGPDAAPELGHVEWPCSDPSYRRLMSCDSAFLLI